MNKFILIGIVATVLLAGGAAAAYYFLVMNAETEGAEPAPKLDKRAFIYVEIPPIVANFDVKGKMRYVQITTSLSCERSQRWSLIAKPSPAVTPYSP